MFEFQRALLAVVAFIFAMVVQVTGLVELSRWIDVTGLRVLFVAFGLAFALYSSSAAAIIAYGRES